MVPEINVYQCIVNISSQDFGIYRNCKAKVGDRSKVEDCEPQGAPMLALEDEVVESQSGVCGVEGCQWALVIFMKVCWWLEGLRSLLGWLWWRWIVLLGGKEGNCFLFSRGGSCELHV